MNALQLEVEKVIESLEGQEEISKKESEKAYLDDFERGYTCGTESAYGDAISKLKEALEVSTTLHT